MTIALGLIAKDGMVIAADKQETEGERKKDQRKIDLGFGLVTRPINAILQNPYSRPRLR